MNNNKMYTYNNLKHDHDLMNDDKSLNCDDINQRSIYSSMNFDI